MCDSMDRRTKIRVWISCLCFLGVIYGIASLDQGHRKQVEEEIATMADAKDKQQTTVIAPKVEQPVNENVMYLTFDDGPSKHTQEVLDILKKYNIKATFFVTGENPEYAGLLRTIHEEGHSLGIHTYSHEYEKIYTSEEAYFEDMQMVKDLIKKESGVETFIIRFPGGSSNTVSRNYKDGIMTSLTKAVEEKGYAYFDWNAHNGDGDPSITSQQLYAQAMEEIKGKKEVVMLLHDGTGNKNTVESLDAMLSEMVSQGWVFKTIGEHATLPVSHHHIAN